MSVGMDTMRGYVAEYLNDCGLHAVTAWQSEKRQANDGTVVAVSMRKCSLHAGGFRNYLGERQNSETGRWEELYGQAAEMTLGLDIYAPYASGEDAIERTFDQLVGCLGDGCGLKLEEISCKETEYDVSDRLLKRAVEAVCRVYLIATVDEDNVEFMKFEVKGGLRNE